MTDRQTKLCELTLNYEYVDEETFRRIQNGWSEELIIQQLEEKNKIVEERYKELMDALEPFLASGVYYLDKISYKGLTVNREDGYNSTVEGEYFPDGSPHSPSHFELEEELGVEESDTGC